MREEAPSSADRSEHEPHLHELSDGSFLFGFRLERLYYREPGAGENAVWLALSHRRKHVDFLGAVHRCGQTFAVAYRIVVVPSRQSYVRGRTTVGMLVRYDPPAGDDRIEQAAQLASEMAALLNGIFEHHQFAPIESEEHWETLWAPFPVAHVAEIRRREDRFSPVARLPLWKVSVGEADRTEKDDRSLYFVYPFVPTERSLERLLSYLLVRGQPCLIDVLLEPTQLRSEEEAVFVRSLQVLDNLVTHPPKNPATGPSALSRTVASFLSGALLSQYRGLLDAPFLVRTAVASPEPLTPDLLHAVGVEFTEPAGGTAKVPGHMDDLLAAQTGGFDVLLPQDEEVRRAVIDSIREVRFLDWGFTLARDEAEKRLRYLFDPVEATSVFRLPSPSVHTIPGLAVHVTRVLPLPSEAIAGLKESDRKDFVVLGINPAFGTEEPVRLWRRDRREHVYIVGQTGTGKSSLLYSMIVHDIWNNDGVGLIDPHGDLFRLVLRSIPPWRTNDVVILDPTDVDHPFALNPLEHRTEFERDFIIQEMIAIARRLYDPQGIAGIVGPVFEDTVRATLMAVMTAVEKPTFAHFLACLTDRSYRREMVSRLRESASADLGAAVAAANLENLGRFREYADLIAYVGSKFGRLLTDRLLRNITLQADSTVDFGDIMDRGRILLVNLNRGQMGLLNAEWLGMFLMMRLELAAMRRAAQKAAQRRDFFMYVDEFQTVASASFAELLGEARKFRLDLTLAHQYYSQVPRSVGESILGNVGTIIAFRLGVPDARELASIFHPGVSWQDLSNQPNFEATVSMVRNSERIRPFTLRTLKPEPPEEVARHPQQLIEASRRQYTRLRREVERELEGVLRQVRWLEEPEE